MPKARNWLPGGGFESVRGIVAVAGWQSNGGSVIRQTADAPAVEGTQYARTWHNQTRCSPLSTWWPTGP